MSFYRVTRRTSTASTTTTTTAKATASTAAPVTGHFLKTRVDLLLSLLEDSYKVARLLGVYNTDEHVSVVQ